MIQGLRVNRERYFDAPTADAKNDKDCYCIYIYEEAPGESAQIDDLTLEDLKTIRHAIDVTIKEEEEKGGKE